MQNVNHNRKRTCLIYDFEELEQILGEIFNDKVSVGTCDGEFDVSFENYEPDVWYEEVLEKLGKYFDVEITSIHIDQWDYPLVWICYEEETRGNN